MREVRPGSAWTDGFEGGDFDGFVGGIVAGADADEDGKEDGEGVEPERNDRNAVHALPADDGRKQVLHGGRAEGEKVDGG